MSVWPGFQHGEFEEPYFFDFIIFYYFMDNIVSKQPETSPPLLNTPIASISPGKN